MIALPFVFFSMLFWQTWRRKGFDVYAYMLFLYLFISFFSILMDGMNLYFKYDRPVEPLGIIAPLIYCILLFVCIKPYENFSSSSIKKMFVINEKIYNRVVFIYFIIFVVSLIISLSRINEIMMSQNLKALRNEYYLGDAEPAWARFSGITRYIIGMMSMISESAKIMLLFFFINIVFLKKKLWFNIITILGSMTPLVFSLYNLDRSRFAYWFILLGLMYVLFRHLLERKGYKNFVIIGIPLLFVVGQYLLKVTVSRFGENSDGGLDGVVYYLGQSYIHFCYYFNDLGSDAPFSLVELFPFTCHKILNMPSYFEQADIVGKYLGMGVSNFSTFLGFIMSISGKIVMLLFVIFYISMANKVVYRRNKIIISFRKLVWFFIFALVIVNGLFVYCYLEYSSIFNIIIWLIIAKMCTISTTKVYGI